MNNSVIHHSGEEKDKFEEVSEKLDEILVDLEKDQVMSMLINYMVYGLLTCSKAPFEEVEFWAKTFVETLKIHANAKSSGTMQ